MENIEKILAKSVKNGGVTLITHSVNVAKKAKELIEKVSSDEELISCVTIAALFHDIGKCTYRFQKHLEDENFIEYIPHNILSASIIREKMGIRYDNDDYHIKNIIRSILYHHPVNFYKITKENEMNKSIIFNDLKDTEWLDEKDEKIINEIYDKLIEIYNSFNLKVKIYKKYNKNVEALPPYFANKFDKDENNNEFFVICNTIRFADHLISSNNIEENRIKRNNLEDIKFIKPDYYDDRFEKQMKYAKECFDYRLSIFESQTGFGKTLLGIKYLLSNNKKGYWICPRNTVAEGVYKNICIELKALNIDNKISVALYLTNEWIFGNENCDIIVTNIDNFFRPTLKADSNMFSFNMLYCNCVFDEFHEFVDKSALMAMFYTAINCRFNCIENSKTLLMSATPIMNFVNEYKKNKNFKYILYDYEPILNKQIKFSFADKFENEDYKDKNWFISVNTVSKAQELFINNKTINNIIHARFIEKDIQNRMKQLYDEHSKNKNIKTSWVATNIISTGIDVSFANMLVSWPTPERLIQSGGRCNRWNECKNIPEWKIVKDEKDNNERFGIDAFIDYEFANLFYNFLTKNIKNGEKINLKKIYNLRKEFYKEYEKEYNKIFNDNLKRSFYNLSELNYEYSNKNKKDNIKYISSKKGFRDKDDLQEFFFKVKYYNSDIFIEDVMQGDNILIKENILKYNKSLEEIYKSINKVGVLPYFRNKKQMENIFNKSYDKFWNILINKSKCSETPLLISTNYYYDEKIGLFKSK